MLFLRNLFIVKFILSVHCVNRPFIQIDSQITDITHFADSFHKDITI